MKSSNLLISLFYNVFFSIYVFLITSSLEWLSLINAIRGININMNGVSIHVGSESELFNIIIDIFSSLIERI
jgi:hypothetical protein